MKIILAEMVHVFVLFKHSYLKYLCYLKQKLQDKASLPPFYFLYNKGRTNAEEAL